VKEASRDAQQSGKYKILEFTPFDPVSKRTLATVEDETGNRYKVAKGAPQAILEFLTDKGALAPLVEENVNALATRGYRPLGVARGDSVGTWEYIGFLGLYDPPREDSAETIKTAQDMDVKVKMVTGDHAAIAERSHGRFISALIFSRLLHWRENPAS
jgi:H+-transporting ATPase